MISLFGAFVFQSTLPARGATLSGSRTSCRAIISIHAPRTGSDSVLRGDARCLIYFNPRSPHGERPERRRPRPTRTLFQSTLPARGATGKGRKRPRKRRISIHAPRTGSDIDGFNCRDANSKFQSTLPARGATANITDADLSLLFQSTLPARGATTLPGIKTPIPSVFQSTLPARGATRRRCARGASWSNFNPRSPHGERLRKVTILSIRIIGFAQKVYHKTVLLRISLAENAVILPEKPRNPVRTSLQKAGGLRFARAIRAARPYSISSPSGA